MITALFHEQHRLCCCCTLMSTVIIKRPGCCRGCGSLTFGLTWKACFYTRDHTEQAAGLDTCNTFPGFSCVGSPRLWVEKRRCMGTSGCLRHRLCDSLHFHVSFQQLQMCTDPQGSRVMIEDVLGNNITLCLSWKALDHQTYSKGHASDELPTGWKPLLQKKETLQESVLSWFLLIEKLRANIVSRKPFPQHMKFVNKWDLLTNEFEIEKEFSYWILTSQSSVRLSLLASFRNNN